MSLKINVNYNIQTILVSESLQQNKPQNSDCVFRKHNLYIMYKKKKIVLKNVQNAANKYQVLCNFSPDTCTPAAVSQPLREFICVQRQK